MFFRYFVRAHHHSSPIIRRSMATRSYQDAINLLNTLQSNAATIEALRAAGARKSESALLEMIEYLGRIGYTPQDLNPLNAIHITGTKGKGSTSAFTESIIRQTKPEWKIGLYTSPHLVAVRERIRINGVPLSEADFARFFFEVWDRLERNEERKNPNTPLKPMYFGYITLVAYHAFLSLKVDATILEVGVGGTYDNTNVVPKPIVTGVTALGLDHTAVLGKTLPEIAWQKGGIYKAGVPALTVEQPEEGLRVLKQRATDLKASEFVVIPPMSELQEVKLGLAGEHQVQNAGLAVHLASRFLAERCNPSPALLSEPFLKGLEATRWAGRCQTVTDPKRSDTTWFLDGAHTVESLDCCMKWFMSPTVGLAPADGPGSTVLIFNCTSGRSGHAFLETMLKRAKAELLAHGREADSASIFSNVVFCANVTYADGGFKGDLTTSAISEADLAELKTQQQLAAAWRSLVPSFPEGRIHVLPSIEHAVGVVRSLEKEGERVAALVTGSLHLVGGAIEVAGLSEVAL